MRVIARDGAAAAGRDRLTAKVLAGIQIGLGVVILADVIGGSGVSPWMVVALLLTIPPTIMIRDRQRRREAD